jgi:protein-S-isoprenylcysteine O-methyltransferase Ste14
MVPIAAGTVGFGILLLFDWADGKGIGALKTGSVICSDALIAVSLIALASDPNRFPIAVWVRIMGGAIAVFYLFLLVFSLFLEIPFRSSYGHVSEEKRLVTTGTYALVRHPGVLWFLFFHLFLVVASGSRTLLFAVPFWTGMNIAVAALEDGFFFPRIFGRPYREYQQTTPFLIPTPASIRRCAATLPQFKVRTWKQ